MTSAEFAPNVCLQPEGRSQRSGSLRNLALEGLARMFDPEAGRFLFRVRRTAGGVVREGHSDRYTAIALLGLAGERLPQVRAALHGRAAGEVWRALCERIASSRNLGDTALTLWAGVALGEDDRQRVSERLVGMRPEQGPHPTVELAWTLSALSVDGSRATGELRRLIAERLLDVQAECGAFAHLVGGGAGLRRHVGCFADQVYPIQALSLHAERTGERSAAKAAERAAELIVKRQGPAGQWWWHYDVRTGAVVEPYPVYAVHQDAMAPMALLALRRATGFDASEAVERGLDWLSHSPELGGGSLVDSAAGLIWRKVARREPGKLSRRLQAAATRLHPSLRVPGLDRLFPPVAVDYEDRPYHLGWLLHAFPAPEAP